MTRMEVTKIGYIKKILIRFRRINFLKKSFSRKKATTNMNATHAMPVLSALFL